MRVEERHVATNDPADTLASRFKAVLDAAPDAMVITDRIGRIILVNAEAERLFGYRREDLLGTPVEGLIPKRFRSAHPGHRDTYFQDPRTRPMGFGGLELFGLRKDGTEFPAEISLSPLETEDGVLAITAVRDITDRKRAEEERARLHGQLEVMVKELGSSYETAKELEQVKTRLFANVSHELRTPLALILGPAEKLLGSRDLQGEQRRDVEVMARNARTLLKHVNDLLDVAQLEAGGMTTDLEDVDVARLVRLVAAHFDGLAAEREMAYVVEAPETLPREVDPDKLQRVLFNLLSNAFKFTPAGGRVRCSVRAGRDAGAAAAQEPIDQGFRIEVADSGPGVPSAARETVFLRFARVESEAARRAGGTGLGLAIAREFVELHGGRIEAGEAPEGGALFSVEFPAHSPTGVHRPACRATDEYGLAAVEELRSIAQPPFPKSDGRKPLALVVEDNSEMSRFLGELLAPEYEVAMAPDGKAALQAALTRPPDVIITDLMMPRMTGTELLRAVREHPELDAVPVVVITARADDALLVQLLREGAQDFLMKPFAAEEVRARVGNLVAMKRARDFLQSEAEIQTRDLVTLAHEVAARKRDLQAALDAMRLAREQAELANQVKTKFLRLASHELRTPLTSLQLQLQLLGRDTGDLSDRQREILRRMGAAGSRLAELIESLLRQAQIASGRLVVQREEVDLAALARLVLEELRPQAEQKGLELKLSVDGGMRSANTDPHLLRLVLVNLVGNAVKFTAEGAVEIGMDGGADELRLSVTDSGPGIPVEDQARIFKPFERSAGASDQFIPGFGLGLALVNDLAAALGARVELQSTVGRGTTVSVVLPLGKRLVAQEGRGAAFEAGHAAH